MVAIAFKVSKPDTSAIRLEGARIKALLKRAALDATDIAGKKAQVHVQAKIRSVGLGKLSNAVGFTSAKRKRQFDRTPYGVIFAKGGDESLAGGALEAYSLGTTITPQNGKWLAVPTKAAPRFVSTGGKRRRLTPALWASAGLNQRIGKLVFRPVRSNLALLVVRRVSLSPKSGQAKALGQRAPRSRVVPKGDVVVFVLIRQTRRAKRFDKDQIVEYYSLRVPDYMRRLLADYERGAS